MKILETLSVVRFEDSLILVSYFASVGKRNVREEYSSRSFIPFKMGAERCLETSGSQDPMTRRHFPEHCNQINHCGGPKTNTVLRFV
jgi:hypothetical protein